MATAIVDHAIPYPEREHLARARLQVVAGGTSAHDELAQLYARYGGQVRGRCRYLLGEHEAEDAAQEAFLRAYRGLDSFRGESGEKTWLTRIAINVCKNLMKSPWRRLTAWFPPDQLPEPSCPPEERDGDVLRAVTRLPVKYREVVLLYYYQEMTLREIALALNAPQATVSTRLARARARLKGALKGWWME